MPPTGCNSSLRTLPLVTGNVDLTIGYSLQRVDVNQLGINLSFTKSGVNQDSQYYWSWWGGYVAPVTTPYKDDIVTSIVYADVSYFEIYNNAQAPTEFPATWCVGFRQPRNSDHAATDDLRSRRARCTRVDRCAGNPRGGQRREPRHFPRHAYETVVGQRNSGIILSVLGCRLQATIWMGLRCWLESRRVTLLHAINGKLCTGEEGLHRALQ